MNFRNLDASEIDCRVATVSEKGCSLLLYQDARVGMNLLDEVVGPENWQKKYEVVNGNLFCSVGIKCGNEWIWKQDVGTESFTEKEKGEASDAFKRACVCWNIGRELYTAPFIWIPSDKCKIVEKKDGKGYTTYDRFEVQNICYVGDKKEILGVTIINSKTKEIVFSTIEKEKYNFTEAKAEDFKETKAEKPQEVKPQEEKITKVQDAKILKLLTELNQSDKLLDDLKNFKKDNLSLLTKKEADQYIKVLERRIKTKEEAVNG